MTILNDEDKPSLEDAMAHFGVKGMHWGQRKSDPASRRSQKAESTRKAHRARSDLIKKAVVGKPDAAGVTRKDKRQAKRADWKKTKRDLEDFHDQPGKNRDAEIKAARSNLRQASRDYKTAKATYKAEKETVGKNAAKIALAKAANEKYKVEYKAEQETRGEFAFRASVEVGLAVAKGISDAKKPKDENT